MATECCSLPCHLVSTGNTFSHVHVCNHPYSQSPLFPPPFSKEKEKGAGEQVCGVKFDCMTGA